MDIKKSRRPASNYKLKFDRREKAAIKSMYNDGYLESFGRDGEPLPSELSRQLARVAFYRNISVIRLKTPDMQALADFLTDYANDTPADIQEISDYAERSPFNTEWGRRRIHFGNLAAGMALQMGVEAGFEVTPLDVEAEMRKIKATFYSGDYE